MMDYSQFNDILSADEAFQAQVRKKMTFPYADLTGDELDLKIAGELYMLSTDIGWIITHHGRFMDTFDDTTREVKESLGRLSGKIFLMYEEYEEKLIEKGVWSKEAGEFEEDEIRGQEHIPPVSKHVEWMTDGEIGSATVDAMCAEFIQKVNEAGHKTIQSCSGAMQDHPGARCGWDMTEGYVSFIIDESFGDYGMFPPEKITPYAMKLYNAINDAGWCASLGTTLFVPTVTARPTCHDKNPAYILWGKEYHGHETYEYLEKNSPELLKYPSTTYQKEAVAAGPYPVGQKNILKKWSEFDTFKCEVMTNDQVMKRKWNDLMKEILNVPPREWT